MLRLAFAFLILALVAALFGFGGLAATSAGIAQSLFVIVLVVCMVTLLFGVVRGRKVV